MAIQASDIRARFTKALIDVYQERIRPTGFLRSFFPTVTEPTKEISIEVERGFEKVAVDVVRGTEGNRNQFSKSTEKIFVPPFYREYFDATQLDLYDRVLGSQGNANAPLFIALMNSIADRLGILQDKIERRYELQAAQVLLTGIVELTQGINIDFKRKAASMVNLNGSDGGYWTAGGVDPFRQLENGAVFLRQKGKTQATIFNLILGASARAALYNNAIFKEQADNRRINLVDIGMPTKNGVGATSHGMFAIGDYIVRLMSYPEYYDHPTTGVQTPYITTTHGIMIPENPRFKMAFAAVPQLVGEPGQLPRQGAYVFGEFIDERKAVHDFDVQSAGLAIPVAVDQIFTFQATAS